MQRPPEWLLIAVSVTSVLFFVATIALVPRALVALPPDYFVRRRLRRSVPYHVAKNLLGVLLLVLGTLMLVLPGQGVLTMLLGIALLDVRWKRTLLLRVLRRKSIRATVETLRERAGAPQLILPAPRRRHDRDEDLPGPRPGS